MDPAILNALLSHTPALIVGAVLLLVVYAAKLGPVAAQWQRLPAWSRPLVPALLGVAAGVGDALTTGQAWLPALITGVLTSLPALAVALPSPVAHLDEVILPNTAVVRVVTSTPKITTADDLADAVLANLDRDTKPGEPPKPEK
jgi:hypothetical protein